jgi:Fe2+ transport system protein FeoA
MSKTLSSVKQGQVVTISQLAETSLKPKLMEMGLVAGKKVKVLFHAPLGDPIAVDMGGCVLSLRLDEAALITIVTEVLS